MVPIQGTASSSTASTTTGTREGRACHRKRWRYLRCHTTFVDSTAKNLASSGGLQFHDGDSRAADELNAAWIDPARAPEGPTERLLPGLFDGISALEIAGGLRGSVLLHHGQPNDDVEVGRGQREARDEASEELHRRPRPQALYLAHAGTERREFDPPDGPLLRVDVVDEERDVGREAAAEIAHLPDGECPPARVGSSRAPRRVAWSLLEAAGELRESLPVVQVFVEVLRPAAVARVAQFLSPGLLVVMVVLVLVLVVLVLVLMLMFVRAMTSLVSGLGPANATQSGVRSTCQTRS